MSSIPDMTKTIKRISDITENPKSEMGVAYTIYTPPKINASFEHIFINPLRKFG